MYLFGTLRGKFQLFGHIYLALEIEIVTFVARQEDTEHVVALLLCCKSVAIQSYPQHCECCFGSILIEDIRYSNSITSKAKGHRSCCSLATNVT